MKYNKIFKNKRVLITGHTGFKGSWLSAYLTSLGAKVYGISKDIPSKPSHFKKINLKNKISSSIFFDLIEKKKLKEKITAYKPDYIFHLAAQSLVGKSYKNPTETWYSNTFGTINILEVLRKINRETVVVLITSDKVYKNIETKKGYREGDVLGGIDPYGASKAAAEIAIKSYINSYFSKNNNNILIGVARAGNVIGGGDWSENRLIPDCVRAWLKNKKAIIRNPNSTRPWQHVLDVLNGYLILAYYLKKKKKGIHGEAFNFGPDPKKNLKVIEILKLIKTYWHDADWKIMSIKKFKENKLLNLDSNKSSKKLKWKPLLDVKSSLELTAKWYKNCSRNTEKNYNITLNQINNFKKKFKPIYI